MLIFRVDETKSLRYNDIVEIKKHEYKNRDKCSCSADGAVFVLIRAKVKEQNMNYEWRGYYVR